MADISIEDLGYDKQIAIETHGRELFNIRDISTLVGMQQEIEPYRYQTSGANGRHRMAGITNVFVRGKPLKDILQYTGMDRQSTNLHFVNKEATDIVDKLQMDRTSMFREKKQ